MVKKKDEMARSAYVYNNVRALRKINLLRPYQHFKTSICDVLRDLVPFIEF